MTHFNYNFESGSSLPQRLVFEKGKDQLVIEAPSPDTESKNFADNKKIQQALADNRVFDRAQAALQDPSDASKFKALIRQPGNEALFNDFSSLIDKGFNLNRTPDGDIGPSSRIAIAFLQFEKGLQVNGKIDNQTRQALRSQVTEGAHLAAREVANEAGKVNADFLLGSGGKIDKALLAEAGVSAAMIKQILGQSSLSSDKDYRGFDFRKDIAAKLDAFAEQQINNPEKVRTILELKQQMLALDLYNPHAGSVRIESQAERNAEAGGVSESFASQAGFGKNSLEGLPRDSLAREHLEKSRAEFEAAMQRLMNLQGDRQLGIPNTKSVLEKAIGVFTFRIDKGAHFVEGHQTNGGMAIDGKVLSRIDDATIARLNTGTGNIIVDLPRENRIAQAYVDEALRQAGIRPDDPKAKEYEAKLIYLPHCNNQTIVIVPPGAENPGEPSEPTSPKIDKPKESSDAVCPPEVINAAFSQAFIDVFDAERQAKMDRSIAILHPDEQEMFGGRYLMFETAQQANQFHKEYAALRAKYKNLIREFNAGSELKTEYGNGEAITSKEQLYKAFSTSVNKLLEKGKEAGMWATNESPEVDHQAIFKNQKMKIEEAMALRLAPELRQQNPKMDDAALESRAREIVAQEMAKGFEIPRILDFFHRNEPVVRDYSKDADWGDRRLTDAGNGWRQIERILDTVGSGVLGAIEYPFSQEAAQNTWNGVDGRWNPLGSNMMRDRNQKYIGGSGTADTFTDKQLDQDRLEVKKTEHEFSTETAFGMKQEEFEKQFGQMKLEDFVKANKDNLQASPALRATARNFQQLLEFQQFNGKTMTEAWQQIQKIIKNAPTSVKADEKGRGYFMIFPGEKNGDIADKVSQLFTKVDVAVGNEIHNYVIDRYRFSEVTQEQFDKAQQHGEIPNELLPATKDIQSGVDIPAVKLTYELYQQIVKGEIPVEAARAIQQSIERCVEPGIILNKIPVDSGSEVFGAMVLGLLISVLPGGGCPGCPGGGIIGGDGSVPPVGGGLN